MFPRRTMKIGQSIPLSSTETQMIMILHLMRTSSNMFSHQVTVRKLLFLHHSNRSVFPNKPCNHLPSLIVRILTKTTASICWITLLENKRSYLHLLSIKTIYCTNWWGTDIVLVLHQVAQLIVTIISVRI